MTSEGDCCLRSTLRWVYPSIASTCKMVSLEVCVLKLGVTGVDWEKHFFVFCPSYAYGDKFALKKFNSRALKLFYLRFLTLEALSSSLFISSSLPPGETRNTCTAAAGTFLLEFGTLSRLTGDPSFEAAARRSVRALWDGRSPLGLVGGAVDGTRGSWNSGHASIGAGTDSYYEYLLKSAKLLGDEQMSSMFAEAYAAVEEHLRWRGWHIEMDLDRGNKVCAYLCTRVSIATHGGNWKMKLLG